MPSQEETKDSIEAFLKEYGELVAKHKVDFVSYPNFVPNSDSPTTVATWSLVISTQPVSIKDQPVKSPFVPNA